MSSPGKLFLGLLPWYSVLIVTGMALAIFLCHLEERRLSLPKDTASDIALSVIPLGIIGARLYYVCFNFSVFRGDLLSVFRIWEGGMAIYGGVIGGFVGIALLARRKGLSLPLLIDTVVPGLALAQGIGRWGNFFNSEAYGAAITSPAWQFFPAGVLIGGQWYMATFFYESIADLAVFAVLWLTRKRRRHAGDGFLGYLVLYGAARCLIEGLRSDSLYGFAGLRVSQILSIAMCLFACAVWARRAVPAARLLLLLPCAGLCAFVLTRGGSLGVQTLGCAVFGLSAVGCWLLLRAREKEA